MPHCPNDGSPVARQSAAQITDTVLAGRTGTRIEILAPLVRGRKGEFRELLRGRAQARLRPRAGGRRRPTTCPRCRRSTAGRTTTSRVVVDRLVVRAGRPLPAQRLDRDRAQGGGRHRRSGSPRQCVGRPVRDVLRAVRLPGLRSLAARARAAAVLVQFTVRRLPRLPRARHPAGSQRRPGARRPQHLDPRGRGAALGRAVRLPAQGGAARRWRKAFKFDLERALGRRTAMPRRQALLHGGARAEFRFQADERPARRTRLRDASGKASSGTSSGATASPPAMRCAAARGVHGRAAVPDLRRPAAQAREPGGAGARARASATWWTCRSTRRSSSSRRSRSAAHGVRAASTPRSPGRSSRKWATGCASCGTSGLEYLTLGRGGDFAVRRRGPAHPARHPDRVAPGRRALHPGRAEHRAAPAGQRAAARHAARAARPGQHGDRGGARRGHDSRRRPRDRPRAARRAARRRGRGGGRRSTRCSRHPTSLTGALSPRRAPGAGAGPAAAGEARRSGSGSSARAPTTCANLTVDIPARRCSSAVTGVSGSGKSTLVTDILYQALARHFYRAQGGARRAHAGSRGWTQHRQGDRHRPEPDRAHPAVESRHLHRAVHARSASCSPSCPRRRCAATGPGASPSM